MFFTLNIAVTQFILPVLFFSSSLLSGVQHQEFVALFGQEYQTRYDQCVEQSSIQQKEITQLKVALSETEVKLKDVDIFRETLEQREDVIKSREDNLKKRKSDIDSREELLEKRIFEFTEKVEEVAKNGGKVEQIIANNEMLTNRVHTLEARLDDERELAREDLEKERDINSRLQRRIDQNGQFMLAVVAAILIIIFAVILTALWLYISWYRGKIIPQQGRIIDIANRKESVAPGKSTAALTSSGVEQE